ncbi:MAG: DUF5684 domain-containing protein [Fimbriimonadaceae bacterium]
MRSASSYCIVSAEGLVSYPDKDTELMIDMLHSLSLGFAANEGPAAGFLALGLGMDLVIILAVHFILAYPLYLMGQQTNQANPWYAFVPFLNVFLLVQISELETWWVVIPFIPCINIASVWIWWKVAERMGKPGWVSLFLFVPCLGLGVPYYIAFAPAP